jgi:hypothetical protein
VCGRLGATSRLARLDRADRLDHLDHLDHLDRAELPSTVANTPRLRANDHGTVIISGRVRRRFGR